MRESSDKKKFYVYVLTDPITGKLFYVGKGYGKRMYEHEKIVKRNGIPNNNRHLYYKIKQILNSKQKIKYKKVLITENEQKAFSKEIELIKQIGLENLCNLTDGGMGSSGYKHSEKTKQKLRIRALEQFKNGVPDATKRKLSKAHKGKLLSTEHKIKLSNSLKGNKNSLGRSYTTETLNKMSEAHKGKTLLEDHKRKIAKSLKETYRKNKEIMKHCCN